VVLIQEEGAIVAAGVGAEASLRRPNLPVGHLLDLFQDPLPLVLDQSRVRCQDLHQDPDHPFRLARK